MQHEGSVHQHILPLTGTTKFHTHTKQQYINYKEQRTSLTSSDLFCWHLYSRI